MPHIGIDAMGSNAHLIPKSTPTVLGYVTGSGGVPWMPVQFTQFPHSGIGRINQNNDTNPDVGNIYDIESLAGTVSGFARWAEGKRQRGKVPIGYGGFDTYRQTQQTMERAGLHVWLFWLARPGIGEHAAIELLDDRIRAVQFAWPTTDPHMILPGSHLTLAQSNCDVSICADDFFPPPHVLPRPHGIANAALSVDLVKGDWHVHGTPGDVRFSDESVWWEAHVGINRHTGEWRVHPMPEEKH